MRKINEKGVKEIKKLVRTEKVKHKIFSLVLCIFLFLDFGGDFIPCGGPQCFQNV